MTPVEPAGDHQRDGTSVGASRVLEALRAGGPEMPIVVLARTCRLPPTSLRWLLDELADAGKIEPGAERRSVRAVAPAAGGRFRPRAGAPVDPVETRPE